MEDHIARILLCSRDIEAGPHNKNCSGPMKDTLLSIGDFLDVLHDASVIVDGAGHIVYASRAVKDIFGYEPAELVGEPLAVLIPHPNRERHEAQVAGFRDSGKSTSMGDRPLLPGLHRSGREVAVSISLSNLDLEGVRYSIAVVRDATPVKHRLGEAIAQAERDPLTGLGNRLHLSRGLESLLADGRRPFTLLYLDLGRFKALNDEYGHGAGDRVLQIVARRLRSHLREVDVAVRLGGDEFVVVFAGLPGNFAHGRIRRVQAVLSDPMHLDSAVVQVRADMGTAALPEDGKSADELLARADAAMYEAKRRAENRLASTPDPGTRAGS